METVKIDGTAALETGERADDVASVAPSGYTVHKAPPDSTFRFECKDKALGGCEGKMRATGHGIYCTRHCNQHAEEWGKFPVSDTPLVQGNDDYNRRHPKCRSRKRA